MASTCGDMAASAGRELFEQLDLSGVIEIVRRHARYQRTRGRFPPCRLSIEIARIELGDGGSQRAMHLLEQRDVRTPRRECRVLRALEPVRAVERKRSACGRGQSPPGDILPVRRMDDELPDVVAA